MITRRRWATCLAVAATLATVAIPCDAAAQRRRPPRRPPRLPPPAVARGRLMRMRTFPEIGLRGGYDFRARTGSLGIDGRIPLTRRGLLAVAPSADLFFNRPGHDWQLNLDGELRAPLTGLYGGGGAALIHHEFDPTVGRESQLGWNLFAGLEPGLLPVRPFVETRWTFQGEHYSAFRLVAGLRVPIGRHWRPGGGWGRGGGRRG